MTVDLARLGMEVDSSDIRRALGELEDFAEGGRRAAGAADDVEESSDRMSGGMRRVATAVGAAVAVLGSFTGATSMVTSGLQRIDAQAKSAQALDTTTVSIQELNRAAELSGASFTELEAGSLRLLRRMSLFALDGGGPAANAIEKLGLNARELLNVPLTERLRVVESALAANASEAERAALLSQLFGDRAFAAFDRLLRNDVIGQATDDIRDLGVAVSDEASAKIEIANDAMSRLGLVSVAVGNDLTVLVAPALQAFADNMVALRKVVVDTDGIIDGLGVVLATLAATQIPAAVTALGTLAGGLTASSIAAGIFSRAMAVARGAVALLGGPVGILLGVMSGAAAAAYLFRDSADDLEDSAYDAEAGTKALKAAMEGVTGAEPASSAAVIALANNNIALAESSLDAARAEVEAARARQAALDSSGRSGRNLRGREVQIRIELAKATEAIAEAEEALATATRDRARAAEEIVMSQPVVKPTVTDIDDPSKTELPGGGGPAQSETTDAIREYEDLIDVLGDVSDAEAEATTASDTLGRMFAQTASSIVRGSENASDAVSKLLDRLADMALQEGFSQIFGLGVSSIFGALSGQPSSAFGPSGMLVPYASGGVFDNGLIITTPTTFPMAGGGTGIMAERGPEAIMPLARGPGGRLGVYGSGGGRAQSMDVRVYLDDNLNLRAKIEGAAEGVAARVVSRHSPHIVRASVDAVQMADRESARFRR